MDFVGSFDGEIEESENVHSLVAKKCAAARFLPMRARLGNREESATGCNVKVFLAVPQEKLIAIGARCTAQDVNNGLTCSDFGAPHIGAPHIGALHIGALQKGALQKGAPHIGAPHIGAPHKGAPHIGAPHKGAPHIGAPHKGAPHIGALHIGAPHIGAPHKGAPHIGALHIGALSAFAF
jgi:hypothetical protein